MDVYRNYRELSRAEKEGTDFRVTVLQRQVSRTVIVAPHGGAIEPGTSEVASAVAAGDMSLALFEGIKSRGNRHLHITSTRFDEPRCVALVQTADTVVAIHGEGGPQRVVYMGGRDEELGAHLGTALERYGYVVKIHKNQGLQGKAATNICNRGRPGAGVQLELSAGLRRRFFRSLKNEGRKRPTDELARFTAAVREGLLTASRRLNG